MCAGEAVCAVVGWTVNRTRKTIDEMDEEFFNFLMQLNMTSTFLATKAVVPHMGEGAVIVNLASISISMAALPIPDRVKGIS